jgi:hypothetical protein
MGRFGPGEKFPLPGLKSFAEKPITVMAGSVPGKTGKKEKGLALTAFEQRTMRRNNSSSWRLHSDCGFEYN